jgi:hypothetical protein
MDRGREKREIKGNEKRSKNIMTSRCKSGECQM